MAFRLRYERASQPRGGAYNGQVSGGGLVSRFPGHGTTGAAPLLVGAGPSTARQCTGDPAPAATRTTQVQSQSTQCFYGSTKTTSSTPDATIEQIIEVVDGKKVVHLRVTFDPGFVDNTYGANAIGWGGSDAGAAAPMGAPMKGNADAGKPGMPGMPAMAAGKPGKGGHTFDDLVGSDHVELKLFDTANQLTLDFKVDYISADSSSPCGYSTLGVKGGEGKMYLGARRRFWRRQRRSIATSTVAAIAIPAILRPPTRTTRRTPPRRAGTTG